MQYLFFDKIKNDIFLDNKKKSVGIILILLLHYQKCIVSPSKKRKNNKCIYCSEIGHIMSFLPCEHTTKISTTIFSIHLNRQVLLISNVLAAIYSCSNQVPYLTGSYNQRKIFCVFYQFNKPISQSFYSIFFVE